MGLFASISRLISAMQRSKMPVDGIEKDYVKIAYAGADVLYVPAISAMQRSWSSVSVYSNSSSNSFCQGDGIEKDYVKIAYAGADVLYVPATQLDQVSKYIGGGEDANMPADNPPQQSTACPGLGRARS